MATTMIATSGRSDAQSVIPAIGRWSAVHENHDSQEIASKAATDSR